MNQITKNMHISEIEQFIPDNCALICCASFETRCLSVPKALSGRVNNVAVYRNCSVDIACSIANRETIKSCFSQASVFDVPFDAPEIVADSMAKTIETLAGTTRNLLIDTTTFTHETLLILLRIVHLFKASFDSVLCMYNGAEEYSPGYDAENTWLSKGCKDVRNVIGFPGIIKPKEKTNLIILAGFELERATKLIELVEPDCLILGNGIDPVNQKISDTMMYFQSKYDAWKAEYKVIEKADFDFSCRDIGKTVKTLSSIISEAPNENYILVPLNTKLSTISAAIVALGNKKIQLCYAVPEVYNYNNYSAPGDKVTVIDLKTLDVFRQ